MYILLVFVGVNVHTCASLASVTRIRGLGVRRESIGYGDLGFVHGGLSVVTQALENTPR